MSLGWRLRSFGGPVRGAASARGEWSRRDGVLLLLGAGPSVLGMGEATPLPGFSPDELSTARRELLGLPELDELPADLDGVARFARATCRAPSARFAVECALADALSRRDGLSVAAWLAAAPFAPVKIGALIGAVGDDAFFSRARDAVARGACILKLKSRGARPEADAERIRELRRVVGSSVELRLDLNGSLDVASARRALAVYAECGVARVEEPTAGRGLLELGRAALPWLADESLVDAPVRDALLSEPACAGVVLKPTLHGLFASLELARRAHAGGKEIVLTHAFEGPVALAAVAELALAIASFAAPVAGVDRHAALEAFPRASFARVPERAEAGPLLLLPNAAPGLGVAFEEETWTSSA